MRPTLHAPVSAADPGTRLAALLQLGVGVLVVGTIAAAVRPIESIVEVGWFDAENLPHLAPLAARWASVFLVSVMLYWLVLGAAAISGAVRSHHVVPWVRRLLIFMALLSSILALHFIVIMGTLSGFRSTWPGMPYEVHLTFVALLAPLVWMAAFSMRADLRAALAILGAVLLALVISLLALDPYLLRMWAIDLGLLPPLPEIHLMITGRVVKDLPYLVPIGPIVWSSFVGRQKTS